MIRSQTREFSSQVKSKEYELSNGKCRICGLTTFDGEWLQYAHILSVSINSNWRRCETDMNKWKDDGYVSSFDNCLLLCKPHHCQCDSKDGLTVCNVKYLQSLKNSNLICTALTKNGNRCSKKRALNSFRCPTHPNGGLESKLEVEQWTRTQSLPLLKSLTSKNGKLNKFTVISGKEEELSEMEKVQDDWLNSITS